MPQWNGLPPRPMTMPGRKTITGRPRSRACHKKILGDSLCPGVEVSPGDVGIQRRCLGDGPGLGSRVIRVDRSRVDQAPNSRTAASFGNVPGDLDILLGEFVPGFDIRPGQMVDHPASCDGFSRSTARVRSSGCRYCQHWGWAPCRRQSAPAAGGHPGCLARYRRSAIGQNCRFSTTASWGPRRGFHPGPPGVTGLSRACSRQRLCQSFSMASCRQRCQPSIVRPRIDRIPSRAASPQSPR